MQKLLAVAACGLVLSGCASTPQKTLGKLDQEDPKYHSEECLRIRDEAVRFDNKVLSRMGLGLALGLLGPFGIPLAAGADAVQNEARKDFNAEMMRRCGTSGGAAVAIVVEPAPGHASSAVQPLAASAVPAAAKPADKACGFVRQRDQTLKMVPCS